MLLSIYNLLKEEIAFLSQTFLFQNYKRINIINNFRNNNFFKNFSSDYRQNTHISFLNFFSTFICFTSPKNYNINFMYTYGTYLKLHFFAGVKMNIETRTLMSKCQA